MLIARKHGIGSVREPVTSLSPRNNIYIFLALRNGGMGEVGAGRLWNWDVLEPIC